MNIKKQFGKRLKELRLQKELTQMELSFRTEINRNYLSDVELGRRNIGIKNIEKLAKGLEIEIWELFLYYNNQK